MDESVTVTIRGLTLSAHVENQDGMFFLLIGSAALLMLTAIAVSAEQKNYRIEDRKRQKILLNLA